ncbi:MAG: pyridoxal 5'-phosphate synthase glutaminase subunit PdxT [Dehalococcoidia bacterium]
MRPRIGVLALQGDFLEHIAVLRRLDVDAAEVRLPDQLEGLDGLIIPGGESTTIARLIHEWELLEPVRRRANEGMAIWGTCAGAILLAERAGDLDREGLRLMDIGVRRNAFGRQVDSFEAELDVPALGAPPFRAVFIRAPIIEDVGPRVETLASLSDGTVVAAQQGILLATSFHPELTGDTRFHEFFLRLAGRRSHDDSAARERSYRPVRT